MTGRQSTGAQGAGAAFDAIASGYDDDFTHSPLGLLLRQRLWRLLERELPSQGRLLELGCGTGEDAAHLARRGAQVVATDQSPEMLVQAAAKAGPRVTTALLDLATPPGLSGPTEGAAALRGPFDGAWSSFGPLNCVRDRAPLWRWLADVLTPGGRLVLVVMSPLAPWDWLWFGAHGQVGPALRRLRRRRAGVAANAGAGRTVQVWYPSWRTLAAEAAPDFDVRRVEGVGVLLPISEAGHLVARAPRLFAQLARVEARLAGLPPWRTLCDHTALVLERR